MKCKDVLNNLDHDTSMPFTKTNKALSTQHGTPLKFVLEYALPCSSALQEYQ